jgi:hypothetical protein
MARSSGTGTGIRVALPAARRKFWSWGREGQGLAVTEIEQLRLRRALRDRRMRVKEPPRVDPAGVMDPERLDAVCGPVNYDDEGRRR